MRPERVSSSPDKSIILLSSGNYSEKGFTIKKIELRLFVEKIDENLGPFSLITTLLETDKGSIEMVYDEGYLGVNSLERAREFLISNVGLSGLILRSLIALKEEIKKRNS